MKIQCPKCAAEYDFPENKLKPEGTKVRCAQCAAVFLVRSGKGDGADPTPSKPPVAKATTPKTAVAADDLGEFFGTPAGQAPSGGGGGGDNLDTLFGEGGDDVLGAPEQDDLFAKPADDDLFGNDDDLFGGEAPAPKSKADDDLFGDGDDLFADQQAKPSPPPKAAAPKSTAEDDLQSLFDDSDVDAPAPGKAAPAAPAAPAAATPAKSAPDFDWDDDGAEGADEGDSESGEAEFAPAIREDDAERVLQQTLIRESPKIERAKPRLGPVFGLIAMLCLAAGGGYLALNPDMLEMLLIEANLKQRPQPKIYVSPVQPVGTPTTSLVQNRNGYAILVVEGNLQNKDSVPHSFVQLRVNLTDESGQHVTATTVYAGNQLSSLQLKNFPTDDLKKLLRVEMGEQLSNFNIKPGAQVKYTAIFAPAPEGYADLTPKPVVLDSARGER